MTKDDYIEYLKAQSQHAVTWILNRQLHTDGIWVPTAFIRLCKGRTSAALILAQIAYWHDLSKKDDPRLRHKHDGHYWILKQDQEWEKEFGLPSRTVGDNINYLANQGLIIADVTLSPVHRNDQGQVERCRRLRLNWPVFLEKVYGFQVDEITEGDISVMDNNRITEMQDNDITENPKNSITLNTETSTESTTETTTASILDHIDDQAPESSHAAAADSVPGDVSFDDKEVSQAVRAFFKQWPLSQELSSDEQAEWLAAVHKFMARQKAEFPKQFGRLIAFIGSIQDAGNIHKPLGFLRHVLEDGIPPKATTPRSSESPRPPDPVPDLPMGDDGNLILPFHTDIDFSKVKTYTRDEARLIALAGGIQQANQERTMQQ